MHPNYEHFDAHGNRLEIGRAAEYLYMINEWFFKWHQIGYERIVLIDSNGRMVSYGGIKFRYTDRDVYWATI